MAGPTFATAGTLSDASFGSEGVVTPAFPETVTSGQVALLVVTTPVSNDGFEIGDELGSTVLEWANLGYVGRNNRTTRAWIGICNGTESGLTETISSFGGTTLSGQIFLFSDARTTSDPFEDAGATNGDSSPATSGTTTTTGADRLGVRIYTSLSVTGSAPSGWTNRSADTGTNSRITLDTKAIASATTEAATSRTVSAAWGVIDFALLPPSTVITPTKFTNSSVFFAPTVATAANNLTPTKFSNTSLFYTPAVVGGDVTLTATKFSNTSTFGAPLVAGDGYVLPALFTNASTFGAPTVASIAASQNLLPERFINTSVFGSQMVSRPGSGERYTLRGQGSKVRLRGRP